MNTTSHIEAFNAELMDAKREALAAIRAIVRTANQPKADSGGDPRILAQARMAATQVLRTAFLKPETVNPDRKGAGSAPANQQASPVAPKLETPVEAPVPTPADQRRAQQIERIAQQAARDLERYKHKISQREERDRRRAAELAARAGAGSTA